MPASGVLSQLMYVSQAVQPMSEGELRQLTDLAAIKNTKRDITGLLVYRAGWFLQILEGDPIVLTDVFFGSIMRDPRHHNIERLGFVYAPRRAFPDWGMKHFDLSGRAELSGGDVSALRVFAEAAKVADTGKVANLVLKSFEASIDEYLRAA